MKHSLVFVLLLTLGGCASTANGNQSTQSMSALPADIQAEVASIPSMCLVVKDFKDQLSWFRYDSAGFQVNGFLTVPVEGKRSEHDLFTGIDSIALSTPYVLVGCDKSANVPKIVKQAFIDAKKRNAPIKVWAKIDGRWELQT